MEKNIIIPSPDFWWLVGLLEGEGSFGCYGKKTRWPRLSIDVYSTDEDVIQSIAAILGTQAKVRRAWSIQRRFPNAKPVFVTSLFGSRAVGWMMTLYAFMSHRRKAAITSAIKRWKKIHVKKAHIVRTWNSANRVPTHSVAQLLYYRRRTGNPLTYPGVAR